MSMSNICTFMPRLSYLLRYFYSSSFFMHPTYQMLCQHLSLAKHKLTKKFEDFPIVYELL